MGPDITIYNATSNRPVILAHTDAGQTLLSEHYDRENIGWICTELLTMSDHRKFRDLHGRIAAARLVVHNTHASERRLKELTGGEYSAMS